MFDQASIRELGRSVSAITTELLDRFAERLQDGPADFHTLVAEELPVATIGGWFQLPPADFPLLRELTHEQVFAQELLPSASQLARSDAATAELHTYFTALVQERRRRPGNDPVSNWIAIWDEIESDRQAADEGVYFLALFVLLAALETTATLLSSVTLLLLRHPRQWAWLGRNREHVPAAVEEAIRYDAPIPVFSRVAGADCVLGGVEIRADEMVHVMVGAANRDPAKHEDAELFDLRRKPAHLGFGGGIHYCLGAPLARMEAQILLNGLLNRFPRLSLAEDPRWAPRVSFRRLLALPVSAG
jgi:cytochrome P450